MYEIKVKIHEEADLYSSLDPDREQLDMEVVPIFFINIRKKREESLSVSTFSVIRQWMRNGSERISGLFWNRKRKMRNGISIFIP